ncbi:MAG: hypothetical protein WBV73_14255 [Phormidium sp.]
MTVERIETSDARNVREIQAQCAAVQRENLRRNVQRRIQIAQERGDEKLVAQLLAELQQL